jgi:A/G-specific adenine glycosylase
VNRTAFRRALLAWYDSSGRELPWRVSTDFYRVWLSEIMLQQTRVEAVIPYYLRFLEKFPSIEALAGAPESDVLTAWSGLGYYSRARNLHRAAKTLGARGLPIAYPSTYDEVRALPGAGPYTAAAIASIALELPHAAVDGNVIRVISRLTNDASESTSVAARREFTAQAAALLDRRRPGDFNQAMMELGATVCLPGTPACSACPVEKFCAARAAGTERELPVKLKQQKTRDVPLELVLVQAAGPGGGRIFLMQRSSLERRLADFWELPDKHFFSRLRSRKLSEFSHQIVNDRFRVRIWRAVVTNTAAEDIRLPAGNWFSVAELSNIPLTTVTKKALATALFKES